MMTRFASAGTAEAAPSVLAVSVNAAAAQAATPAKPAASGGGARRRRRRSSVMDLVSAFRRGSLEQNKEKEKELAEQREQRANELLSIHPSVKPLATPDDPSGRPTAPVKKDGDDHSGGKGWTRARRASFAPEMAAGEAWQKLSDPASGSSYWWNPTTQESRWTDPHGMANVVAAVAAVAAPAARPSSSAQQDPPQKQDDWMVMKDPGSGREYYFNSRNNESRWEKPATMERRAATTTAQAAANSPATSSRGDASSASVIAELRAQLLAEKDAHAASRTEFRGALDAERAHWKNEMSLAREDNARYLKALGEESRIQAERESAQIAKLTALMEAMVENEQRHEDVLLEKEEQVAALHEQVRCKAQERHREGVGEIASQTFSHIVFGATHSQSFFFLHYSASFPNKTKNRLYSFAKRTTYSTRNRKKRSMRHCSNRSTDCASKTVICKSH
jgi:hypothetical protein